MRCILLINLIITSFSPLHINSQLNINKYLWEYPLQTNLVMDEDLTVQMRDEMQK